MIRKALVMVGLVLMGVGAAKAGGILEIRGGAGLSSADVDSFDESAKAANAGGISGNDFHTYHADIFINLPAIPIGFGVRHEWLNLNASSSGGSDIDLEATNLSLLVDLRLIDSDHFYVGPIVAIGHPSAKVDFKSGTAVIDDDIDGDEVSYAGALEAGVYLGSFLIGGEAGYQSIELETDSNGTTSSADFDASGFYGKAMVGVTFF